MGGVFIIFLYLVLMNVVILVFFLQINLLDLYLMSTTCVFSSDNISLPRFKLTKCLHCKKKSHNLTDEGINKWTQKFGILGLAKNGGCDLAAAKYKSRQIEDRHLRNLY